MRKSVNISQSYHKNKRVLVFYGPQCIVKTEQYVEHVYQTAKSWMKRWAAGRTKHFLVNTSTSCIHDTLSGAGQLAERLGNKLALPCWHCNLRGPVVFVDGHFRNSVVKRVVVVEPCRYERACRPDDRNW